MVFRNPSQVIQGTKSKASIIFNLIKHFFLNIYFNKKTLLVFNNNKKSQTSHDW